MSVLSGVAQVCRAVGTPWQEGVTPGQLLTDFAGGDRAAFAGLVRRLGPMVLGVCRRFVRDGHLAEDAFQTAFVILARRAADVRPAETVAGWLYGVAVRVAKKARDMSARRRTHESSVPSVPDRAAEPVEPPDADALRVLDEEVAALPEQLRVAVVLCALDGLGRKDAAAQLGIREGTLSSRLARARKRLAERLRSRGIAPAAGLTILGTAALPPRLVARTAAIATTGGPLPPVVSALSNGVLRAMFLHKLKVVPVALGLVAVFAGGLLLAADSPRPEPRAAVPLDPPPAAAPAPPGAASPAKLSAPVAYQDLMLVLVTKEGAAAVVFFDPREDGAEISYKFRYESADGKTTKSGEGKLFERRLGGKLGFDPDGLFIKAGPIEVEWSRGRPERGWIYYAPEVVTVHLAHADNFEDNEKVIGAHLTVRRKALDLKRFMRK